MMWLRGKKRNNFFDLYKGDSIPFGPSKSLLWPSNFRNAISWSICTALYIEQQTEENEERENQFHSNSIGDCRAEIRNHSQPLLPLAPSRQFQSVGYVRHLLSYVILRLVRSGTFLDWKEWERIRLSQPEAVESKGWTSLAVSTSTHLHLFTSKLRSITDWISWNNSKPAKEQSHQKLDSKFLSNRIGWRCRMWTPRRLRSQQMLFLQSQSLFTSQIQI